MTIEKVSVKTTKTKTDKSKGKTKAKATAKTGNIKQKTGKVEQNVNVNITAPRKRAPKRKALTGTDPAPKYYQPAPSVAIGGRVPLVNSSNNVNPVDKNIQANPIQYLESSIPPAEHTKAFIKVKKGQNPLNVEVEQQNELFEFKPNEKGKGLAENVEGQTQVKIQVDKPKRTDKKLDLEPVNQFIQTYAGNTDKEVAFDTQAEGNFESNAEKGMAIKSKGRPPKYATEEERKAAKRASTAKSKAAKAERINKYVEDIKSSNEVEAVKKSLKEKGVYTGEGYRFGKVPAVIEGEEEQGTLLLPALVNKKEKAYLDEMKYHRNQEKQRREMFLEGEAYSNRKFVDSSLGKLYENQFDDEVNFNNATNNNPVRANINELINDDPSDSNATLAPAFASPNYVFA